MDQKKDDINLGGRPSKYKPAFNNQAYKLCLLGATDKELAEFFEVQESTINNWKIEYPRFLESLKRGKLKADSIVAEKLFKRATGYSHPDVDIKVIDEKIVKTTLTKHYPPDTTAAIFWLKNRAKDNWRDKQHVEIDFETLSDEQLDIIIEKLKNKARK
jgi:hypothetical protein